VKVCRASCRRGRPARRGLHGSGGLQGGGERPFPIRAGDGGVAGFGGVGGLLFSLGEASEGRIIGRLPFLGSSTVLLLGQADSELLLLEVGGCCSGSRFQIGASVSEVPVGGPVMAQHSRKPAHTRCSVVRGVAGAQGRCSAGGRRAARQGVDAQGRCSTVRKREESRSSSIS
jgi:hypothetical protein